MNSSLVYGISQSRNSLEVHLVPIDLAQNKAVVLIETLGTLRRTANIANAELRRPTLDEVVVPFCGFSRS